MAARFKAGEGAWRGRCPAARIRYVRAMSAADEPAAPADDGTDPAAIDAFIARWEKSGGAELANFQMFADELCDLLGLPRPDPSQELNEFNDYVFERRVAFKHDDGTATPGRIDLYRRGSFVMEAKQSAKRVKAAQADPQQPSLLPEDAAQVKAGTAIRGTRGWDKAMRKAKRQAEDYARALPREHGWPPFILVVDVGYVMEVYADFSGQGKNYAQFPDRAGYSIPLADLRDPAIRARLRAIWTDPQSLDPARRSAEVTRDIAERLARIARNLEGKHDTKEVAEFLMRCLFTMFAEDVGLLPERGFEKLLERIVETPQNFQPALESLWRVMDEGGYDSYLNETVKRFNGALFRNRKAIALDKDDIRELWIAASRDWRDVEPAIFGTLLERALDRKERAKLGAHYTPRAYVERLVVPTIIEPLRADWEEAQARAHEQEASGNRAGALKTVKNFHHTLCTTRVLDPACGTGNFLYVALELMKRLEGEVLEALEDLGEDAPRFAMEGETVSPRQFYGLELNPRAVVIADLVLWIGYLKWQLRTVGAERIAEPVLHAYGNIEEQDAILTWDKKELLRDEKNNPLSRWDGVSTKIDPITGEEIPDLDATVELYHYENPRTSHWPVVEFIVGNPPFVGNKRMRKFLGWNYVDCLFDNYDDVPNSADYVMYWWSRCAKLLEHGEIRQFGLVTTNSIKQYFNRRILEKYVRGENNFKVIFAIPDHPWIDTSSAANVRVSMTTCSITSQEGKLDSIVREVVVDQGEYEVYFESQFGLISESLTVGTNPNAANDLLSNRKLCGQGVKVVGDGFYVPSNEYSQPQWQPSSCIRNIVNVASIKKGNLLGRRIIDFSGLTLQDAIQQNAHAYQRVKTLVKPLRDENRRESIREIWWRFAWERPELRAALADLTSYLVTPATSKHRYFIEVPTSTIWDGALFAIAASDPMTYGILNSRIHVVWALAAGGTLEDRPTWTNTTCFDKFPLATDLSQNRINPFVKLKSRHQAISISHLGKKLKFSTSDRFTVLERVRELENGCAVEPLSAKERDIHEAGLVSVLKEIHDDIDRAVFEAYGWADLIPALVGKPGATAPSRHKTPEQEEAEEELLSRLVALNRERAEEERRGLVRWLRPDYQIPKLGHKVKQPEDPEQTEADLVAPAPADGRPAWPKDGLDQIRILRDMLGRTPAPLAAASLSAAFKGRNTVQRKLRVEEVLKTLVDTGAAQQGIDGQDGASQYFIPR